MKVFVGTENTSAKYVSGRPDESDEVALTIQLFQGELLGLSDETEDHKPGDQIEPSVKPD
jgi:hypothetical protein